MFLPLNITNNHQPADIGMVTTLKVSYKMNMIRRLLSIFDKNGGPKRATRRRKHVRKGCSKLNVGGKTHVLDT